jgi:hypothetical protein
MHRREAARDQNRGDDQSDKKNAFHDKNLVPSGAAVQLSVDEKADNPSSEWKVKRCFAESSPEWNLSGLDP